MAKDSSFDIVSEIDLQVIDDVVNVTKKEIDNRFDLKGTGATIEFNRLEKKIIILGTAEFQIKQMREILRQKMAKRNVSSKCLKTLSLEKASNDMVRETNEVICGITHEIGRDIVKDIKTLKCKVQAAIQEDKIRVSGKSKDDLQEVITLVRGKEYPIPLQFINYR
jgi:cyclic-di-GMP-binding protein